MSNEAFVSEWDNTRYPREKNTGVALGLELHQLIFVITGAGFSVLVAFILPFPVGFLVGFITLVAVALIGIPRVWGRSLLAWAWKLTVLYFRGARDQRRYHRDLPVTTTAADRAEALTWENPQTTSEDGDYQYETESTLRPGGRDKHGRINPGPGWKFNLPGEANEVRAYELPGGAGFIYDPRRKEGIVVAQLATRRAFALESLDAQEDRTRGFRDSIKAIAGVPGVARWQMSDQTTMISGSRVKAFYEEKGSEAPLVEVEVDDEDAEIYGQLAEAEDQADGSTLTRQKVKVPLSGEMVNPWLHESYLDLIEEAQDQPVHELWLTIVLDARQLERRALAAGGGLRGFMEVAMGIMGNIETIVPTAGVRVQGWHTPRSVAALSRSAWDPDSTLQISDREAEYEGAAPEEAGPMAVEVYPRYLWSDGWYHRTFTISEWPQALAKMGFLDDLIFAGDFRHTVTVVMKPKDLRAALRKTKNRKADHKTADNIRRKLDRPEDPEHELERENIDREEQELMMGNVPVDIVALVTVSGEDEEALESNCADLRSRAAQANCEIRQTFGQQDSAFIAGALPFGLQVIGK